MKQASRQQLKGAFPYCRWCHGMGCLGCDEERRKYEEQMAKPIFSAERDDPEDMAALRRVIGREALEHAFGPDGNGVAEVEYNAAIESLKQCFRKAHRKAETSGEQPADLAPDATTSPTLAQDANETDG